MTTAKQFIVGRKDLNQTKLVDVTLPQLSEGQILVKVDRFAFTANNITYAITGDMLQYWSLFPAPDGYGIIPVWGFGDVIVSNTEGIEKGERLFGYFPMATHLVMEPADVKRGGFRDSAAHRQKVSPVYNAYARITNEPAFKGRDGDDQALLRPLFMLSFLVDDYLAENSFFGAQSAILSSASSKTAFGLARLLHTNRKPIEVIGITSPSNRAFVETLQCYDKIVGYDDFATLPADKPVAFVDMAGSASLREKLHRHFGDNMKYSGRVGLTHQDGAQDDPQLPGAKPAWFFAPDHIRKRAKDWGPGGLDERFNAVWSGFTRHVRPRIEIIESRGGEVVEKVYRATLEGRVRPEQAHMLTMAEA